MTATDRTSSDRFYGWMLLSSSPIARAVCWARYLPRRTRGYLEWLGQFLREVRVLWRGCNCCYDNVHELLEERLRYQLELEMRYSRAAAKDPEPADQEAAERRSYFFARRLKSAAALKVCLRILRRIRTDWYYNNFCRSGEGSLAVAEAVCNRDTKLLYRLLGEYHGGWWR